MEIGDPRHPARGDSGRCDWCGRPGGVPFQLEGVFHPDCHYARGLGHPAPRRDGAAARRPALAAALLVVLVLWLVFV